MRHIKEARDFVKSIYSSRELLVTLAKNDFRKQFLGSYLGLTWAFIQPLTFILVIWFVFEIGFKAAPVTDGTPFFLYLITGMIPWFFISNAFTSATESIVANSFLVKKITFRINLLPLIQISSTLIIHLFLVGFLICAFLLHGYTPTLYWLQLPFYILCSISLLLGLSWITASIRVFIKDVGQFISILMQIGFWATPIFWSIDTIPFNYQWLIKLNPAYYIVTGYRDTFINQVWFWEHMNVTLYYFCFTLFSFILGAVVFRKLRPHFGDVL